MCVCVCVCVCVPVNPPSAMLNMNLVFAFFFSSLAAPAAAAAAGGVVAAADAPLSLLLSPFCSLVASSVFGASFSSFRSAAGGERRHD